MYSAYTGTLRIASAPLYLNRAGLRRGRPEPASTLCLPVQLECPGAAGPPVRK